MTISWDSLYLPSADQQGVAATLRQSMENLGYTLYDAFGPLPGKSYARTVRLFVGPPTEGWIRVIGTPDPRLLMPLASRAPCLYLGLDGEVGVIDLYAPGGRTQPEVVLLPYLRDGCTADDLRQVLYGEYTGTGDQAGAESFAHLPDDVQAMTGKVNARHAQKMFQRLSGNLLKKTGADAQTAEAARALLQTPDWTTPGAQRLLALVDCLALPDNWREPDFVALRDAYQLYARRQRKPDARLYPGDEDIMARVPDALDYIPVYGGRDD